MTSKSGDGPPKFEMKMSAGIGKIVKANRVQSQSGGGGASITKKENTTTHNNDNEEKHIKGDKGKKEKEKDVSKNKKQKEIGNKKDRDDHGANNKKEKNKGAMKGGKGEKEQYSSSTWQCPVCTYIHSFQEAAFLACKACGAERSGTCS